MVHGVWLSSLGAIGLLLLAVPVEAQIIPDETLGNERSTVTRGTIRGVDSDRIDGGARRGPNLFHSFQQFDVLPGRGAYFSNPAEVSNIFSRVTGIDRSEIFGRLGVLGNANLFFMNPNGILFGTNSSLDVAGSFVGTTANAIQFGEQGFFSATNPELPAQLLTIAPSAFLFNQIPAGNLSSITNASRSNGLGLRVGNGQNLLLLGGSIANNGGLITSVEGRIEIGSVAGTGSVEFNIDGSLNFPQNLERGNIAFTNRSFIGNFVLNSGGDTVVTGHNITLAQQSELNSELNTELFPTRPPESQAGDVILNATGAIQIRGGSRVSNIVREGTTGNAGAIRMSADSVLLTENARLSTTTFGQGNAGNIFINAQGLISLDSGSTIFGGAIEGTGSGNGGNVQITTGSLSMTNGARLVTYVDGSGNAGDISIEARDQVLLSGRAALRNYVQSGIGNSGNIQINTNSLLLEDAFINNGIQSNGKGNGSNIRINSQSVSLIDTASILSFSLGQGNAGDIIITAKDQVVVNTGATIDSRTTGAGTGGDVQIQTGSLEIIGDGVRQIGDNAVGVNTGFFTSTAGQGNSGSISIDASNQITLNNGGVITTRAGEGNSGNAGDIRINTGSLTVRGFSSLATGSTGAGNAGNVIIHARDNILFSGGILDSPVRSGVRSNVIQGATGNSGNIEITTGSLRVEDLASLSTSTGGEGDTGNVIINARDTAVFDNGIILTRIEQTATGNGGDIRVTANSLSLLNGGQLDASTFGRGDSGDVIVTARDRVLLDGVSPFRGEDGNSRASTLFTEVVAGAAGNGGDVIVTTGSLIASNGGRLEASTEGTGDAGSVIVNARDVVSFDGTSPNGEISSGALSNVVTGATGNGGNIEINTANLRVSNGAQLDASTEAQGSAGNITIRVEETVAFDGGSRDGRLSSAAFTRVDRGANGNGGNLEITANSVSLTNGASLQAETLGQGNAGNVTINAREQLSIDGFRDRETGVTESGERIFRRFPSGIFSDVGEDAIGEGGDIRINTPRLSITNQASINASTSGIGDTGAITITADEMNMLGRSNITNAVNSGAIGNAQQITLKVSTLSLQDSLISAATSGQGNAGAIQIRNADRIHLNNGTISTAINEGAIATIPSNIEIETQLLSLAAGANITANTRGQGNAGNITVRSADRISLNNSTIATDVGTTGTGQGGRITIRTDRLNLNHRSRISARTQGQGQAGDIDVFAAIVSLANGSRLQTNTSSNQNAGNITLAANDWIAITGTRSGIFASTTENARGNGGFIQLNSRDINLNQRGQISAQSRGRGQAGRIEIQADGGLNLNARSAISTQTQRDQAGNIFIQANQIAATNSDITTSAARSSGGNIRLVASTIRLNGDSDLRTNSRTDGGNITLSADFIIALEDSDIFAFAGARGGAIQLDTPAFFGNQYQSEASTDNLQELDRNDRTDINASGQIRSGEIATPDTSFIQNSLTDLPEAAIDTQALISSSCVVQRDEQDGSFTIPGAGGLPQRPGELPRSQFPTGEVRSIPDVSSDSEAEWQPGDAIVEPQGVYQLPDGRLVLSRECS